MLVFMREKARVVINKIFRAIENWRHRVVYFFNYHKLNKRVLKWGGIAVAGLAVFVTIAALLPDYLYKETVTVGEYSFTGEDVVSYEDDIKAYFENGGIGTLADDEGDTRSDYEISFDDRFKNIALQQKAQECGIELDDSENNTSLNYNYDFTLIREQNKNWEKKLEKCAITARNVLYIEAAFDTHEVDQKSQEEADAIYADAIERLNEIEPMLKNGSSADEIMEAVKKSNETNNKDPYVGEDLALHTGVHWCATDETCLNSDPELATNDSISKPQNIINANTAFEEGLQNKGDVIGLITGDNGWFAYYRLEEKTGEFATWNEYYQSMKDQYAYNTVPTAVFGAIKTVASPILSLFEQDNAYAANAVKPYLYVQTDDGASLTNEFYIAGTKADGTPNSLAWIQTYVHYLGHNNNFVLPGGSYALAGNHGGPLNCADTNAFDYFYVDPSYELVSWQMNNQSNEIIGGTFEVIPEATWGNADYGKGEGQPYFLWEWFGWAGGFGQANAWANLNLGFVLTVKSPQKPQPVEDSEPVTRATGDLRTAYNTDLVDVLHVKEAVFSTDEAKNGLLATAGNYKWAKTGGVYNSATFNVELLGPCYGADCPGLSSGFSGAPANKYFSFAASSTETGWETEKTSTLIIGDDVINQASSALTSEVGSGNVVSLSGATTSTLTSWFNNSSNSALISSKNYIVIYIGANDLTLGNSSSSAYDSRVSDLISAIRSVNSTANIIFLSPFNSFTTTNSTYSPNGGQSPDEQYANNDPWRQMNYYATSIATHSSEGVKIIPWFGSSQTVGTTISGGTDDDHCGLATGSFSCIYNVNTTNVSVVSGQRKGLNGTTGINAFSEVLIEGIKNLYPRETTQSVANKSGYGQRGFGSTIAGSNNLPAWATSTSLTSRGTESVSLSGRTSDPGSSDWNVSATFSGSASLPAGIYYFRVNSTTSWQPLTYWYAPYGGSSDSSASDYNNEQVIKTFQPQVVSNVSSNYLEEGEELSDTIYIQEATNESLWPINSDGTTQQKVNVCVDVYGPFATPLASTNSSNFSGTPDRPAVVTSGNPSYIGNYQATECNGMSPSDTSGVNFTFAGSEGWDSGYYYFYEYVNKGNQTGFMTTLIEESFYPAFNPNPSSGDYSEWTFRKFQPFVTSNVENSDPWIDVKEDNSTGEDIVDHVVARAAKSVEEANNGYQDQDTDKDTYWPKYNNSANEYVPVLYHFYICGPYQYPQAENGEAMTNPTTGEKCNSSTAIKTITKYITPNSCSRNPVIQNSDGSWPAPGASGNTMESYAESCEINFGRTDGDDDYYQPGYYYFTSELIQSEQTTYVSSSALPGLTTQTQMSSLISGNWYSKFNPLWKGAALDEIEWAYVQFQPVARSYMGATQDDSSPNENNWTTKLSYLYTDTTNQYKGLQLNCDEHNEMPTYTDMINDTDFWDKVPATTLTCRNVSDRVYIGATTTKDVDYSTGVVEDDSVDEKNWPKTNDAQSGENGANYEAVKYRVRLYGPFATASAMTGKATAEPTPSGDNEAGSTVTVVPNSVANITVGEDSQPVAESCLMTAKYGPNYDDFVGYNTINPNNSLNNYYHEQFEKTSINGKGYYKATFTRDTDIDCAGDGSGSLGLLDSNGTPYTTLSLRPGMYVSVVEVWKSDMNENNVYNSGVDTSDTSHYFDDNGDRTTDSQTINSADKRGQIRYGEVRDQMANDFHSKWGDPYETIFVPPDTDVWTLRGNMQNYIVDWGARYSDQYWTIGWSNWRTSYKDIFGNSLPEHNAEDSSYKGETDYFAPDKDPTERAGQIRVDLYGAFDLRPDTAECPVDKRIATWYVDTIDTDRTGDSTKLENMLPSSGDGWYVYVFSYGGDDRIPALQTKCSDPDEQFYLGEPEDPALETQIDIINANGKAPTVVSDTVKVSGYVEKDSVVQLSLYRRGGTAHNPNADTQICSVQFKIPSSIDPVTYSVSDYMDKNGYVFSSNTPEGVVADPNRCFTDEAGHYYWYEEFFGPDGEELMPPRADGPNEWVDLEKEYPTVTTMADASVMVGDPFHDVAQVTIPEGDEKTYQLYMRAYGPTTGAPVCDTTNKTNLLFESGPHEVTETGQYPSAYTASLTTGYVYWIETLIDKETQEVVAEGYCGKALEITRIYDTEAPGDPWEWTAGAPAAGEIVLSAVKIVGLISLLGLGAWQLIDRNSWLMRRMNR